MREVVGPKWITRYWTVEEWMERAERKKAERERRYEEEWAASRAGRPLKGIEQRRAEGAYYRERHERMKQAAGEQLMLLDVAKKQCVVCESTDELHQHHLDWNRNNNALSNLAWICKWCHRGLHRDQGYMTIEELRAGLFAWRLREREQDRQEEETG